jgi:MarR family transcriptional regulator, organic hydroperoxide resistance regulator
MTEDEALGLELQPFKDAYPWADVAALELNQRMAAAEAARRAALVHRWNTIGLSKATGQYTVLRNLHFAGEHRMTQTEIGRRMNVTSSNVTRLIDGLEQDGLVRRIADHSDRRVTYVELTSEGRTVAERIVPAVVQFAMDVAQEFSPEELQTLLALLTRLQTHVESLDETSSS